MADNIEESLLISLVKERPVIWDRRLGEYKDKARTFEAWREVCAKLNEDFPSMTNGEKILYGKGITKKWNTLRDSWMKCHKKLLSKTTTDCGKKIKKYVYYDQMIFLSKIAPKWDYVNDLNDSNSIANSNDDRSRSSDDEDSDYNHQQTSCKKKKEVTEPSNVLYFIDEDNDPIPPPNKKKNVEAENEVDARLLKFINSVPEREEISPIMSFFKSIEPTITKFDETELVEFQYQVMSIIRNIQHKQYSMK